MVCSTSGNDIGGLAPQVLNVISNNPEANVALTTGSANNFVRGNFIGTDVNGTSLLGGGLAGGVQISGTSNTVGGTTAAARNIISGNGRGIWLLGSGASGNLIQGNFIGTDVTGTSALGNTSDGVEINGAPSNTIGGSS